MHKTIQPSAEDDVRLQEATAKIDEYARGMISGSGSTLFEELGLYYIGPIDGHNIDDLIAVLQGKTPTSYPLKYNKEQQNSTDHNIGDANFVLQGET